MYDVRKGALVRHVHHCDHECHPGKDEVWQASTKELDQMIENLCIACKAMYKSELDLAMR